MPCYPRSPRSLFSAIAVATPTEFGHPLHRFFGQGDRAQSKFVGGKEVMMVRGSTAIWNRVPRVSVPGYKVRCFVLQFAIKCGDGKLHVKQYQEGRLMHLIWRRT
eukprot:2968016-Rhodomonas_salina.2